VSREVEVQLKHLVSSEIRWSSNERVVQYRIWSAPALRPATGEEPARGTITCGDCDAVFSYRLWTVERTRRRQRILGSLALGSFVLVLISLILLLRGSLGDYGFVVPPLMSGAAFGLTAAYSFEKGIRTEKARRPDGRRARRHQLTVKHIDDPPVPAM
jgi:hypothetical protein